MNTVQTPTSSTSSVKSSSTPSAISMEEEQQQHVIAQTPIGNHNYPSGCRRDANCGCSICLESIKSMLDLMPMSAQRTSLSKFSASRPLIVVEKTPISIDPTLLSTPTSRISPDPNPIRIFTPTPAKSTAKSAHPKPKSEPRRTRSMPNFNCRILGRILMCLTLLLAAQLAGSRLGFRVFDPPRMSSHLVEKLVGRSLGVNNLAEKFRVLEKGLKRYGFGGEISSCVTTNSTWKIDQDGLLLNSRCTIYKSAAEELAIWGWPFQTSGLLTAGFSSRSMTVIYGRIIEWENGGIGSLVARNAGSTWVLQKWCASAVQFDPNTWVLEYKCNMLDNPRFLSVISDFLKYVVSDLGRRASKVFWVWPCMSGCNSHCGDGGGSMAMPRASNIPT